MAVKSKFLLKVLWGLTLSVGGFYLLGSQRLGAQEEDDRFVLVLGRRDILQVQDLSGNCLTPIPLATAEQEVQVGQTVFRVSYGRNPQKLKVIIINPSPTHPQDLHFRVLKNQVDMTSLSLVTMTFSGDEKKVEINPGPMGQVEVTKLKDTGY